MTALARGDEGRILRFVAEAESFGGDHPFEGEFLTQLGTLVLALRKRTGDAAVLLEQLTAREREILELVAEGLTNGEIAARLWISPGTVRKHLDNTYAKLGVHTRTAAAALLRN